MKRKDTTTKKAERYVDDIETFVTKYPFMTVAGAFALGAILSSLLPRNKTRRR